MTVRDGAQPGVAETHSAYVFFVGDRAYKLKKAVDLGFLDFTTREAREAVCHREVELNRRLAPDVYLGVADVHGSRRHPVRSPHRHAKDAGGPAPLSAPGGRRAGR